MKDKISFLSAVGGVLSGTSYYEETTQFKTIKQVLEMRNKEILKTDNEQDNEGLVLAQKYREYGTITRKEERKIENQQNPGFLEEDFGNKNVKYTENKSNDPEFEKDERIVEELKKECLKSLNMNYSIELYNNVLKGCNYKIPDYAKDVFKFQKDNGNCRLGVVLYENDEEGGFIGEILEDTVSNGVENRFILNLYDNLKSNETIKSKCQENSKKIVEIKGKEKQLEKQEGNNKKHKGYKNVKFS